MGIRERLNKNPIIVQAAAVLIIGAAFAAVFYEIRSNTSPAGQAPTARYFSDDDGATYFSDALTKIPPFDHNGHEAVVANVFRCKSGKPFIAYLQRYTPQGLKDMQTPSSNNSANIEQNESEMSLPLAGEKGWVKVSSKAALQMMNLKCPDGSTEDIEAVNP